MWIGLLHRLLPGLRQSRTETLQELISHEPISAYKTAHQIELFTVESNLDEFIDEVLEAVSGVGYRWVWLTSEASVRVAQEKALQILRRNAANLGAGGVIGLRTNISAFPGFLFFRGCAVLVTGTAVTFKPTNAEGAELRSHLPD